MGTYNMKAQGNELDWEETLAVKPKTGKKYNSDFDSDDSERYNETLSDWDIDVTESIAANKWKSTVAYTAPKKKKAAQKAPEPEYYDEYYEEEEEENEQLQEVDDEGEEIKPV